MGLRFISVAFIHNCRLSKAENIRYPGTYLHGYVFTYTRIHTTAFNKATDEKLVPLTDVLDDTILIKSTWFFF